MIFPQDCTGGSTGTPARRCASIVWALRGARVYGLPTQVNNHMGLRWKPIAVPHSKPVAFHAVRLQEAVYPETAETGFVDRNNLHRGAAGSLRSGLQPLQQDKKSGRISCTYLMLADPVAARRAGTD
jgi:hypothetical protein